MMLTALVTWILSADPTAPFESAAGGFSALFPGVVREQVKTQSARTGTIDTHVFNAETEEMGFLVSYADHAPEVVKAVGPRAQLVAAREAVVGTKGRLLTERELTLQGKPGIEFRFAKDGVVATERAFWVGRRLYQVMALGSPGETHDRAATIFLDSFKLVEPAKRSPRGASAQ